MIKPGSKQPVSHHQTQANVQKAAKEQLRREGTGGEVAIHRPDGTIHPDTIPPAKDPNPPKH